MEKIYKINSEIYSEEKIIETISDFSEVTEIKYINPELKIDEEKIEKILREIEEETETEIEEPIITANLEGLKKAKEQFKK